MNEKEIIEIYNKGIDAVVGLKKKPRNSRKKSGKSTGGQLGHEGRTLEKIENPDEIIDLHPH